MTKTILAVDDQAMIRSLVQGILRKNGYEVITAESGEDCLRALEKTRPDLVLLDVDMPGMNGFETCREIRKTRPDLKCPIIFLTGRRTRDDVQTAMSAGGNDFLVKPFQPNTLEQRIGKWIERGAG